MTLQLAVLWLHVLAAIAWIGGMLFVAAVLAPALRPLPPAERTALFDAVGRRFSTVGWVSIALLLLTGIGNVLFVAPSLEFLVLTRAGPWLAVKLLFFAGLVVLSWLHDFRLGPRQVALAARLRTAGNSGALAAEVERTRRLVRRLAQVNLLLGLAVVLIGVALRFLW